MKVETKYQYQLPIEEDHRQFNAEKQLIEKDAYMEGLHPIRTRSENKCQVSRKNMKAYGSVSHLNVKSDLRLDASQRRLDRLRITTIRPFSHVQFYLIGWQDGSSWSKKRK